MKQDWYSKGLNIYFGIIAILLLLAIIRGLIEHPLMTLGCIGGFFAMVLIIMFFNNINRQ